MTKKVAIIGGGVIGGGWAARFLLNGWDVSVYDPDPSAEETLFEVFDNARFALPMLYECQLPKEGKVKFCKTIALTLNETRLILLSILLSLNKIASLKFCET